MILLRSKSISPFNPDCIIDIKGLLKTLDSIRVNLLYPSKM